MATYEATIGSAWPAGRTFSYLAVFSNAQAWDPGVLEGCQLDPGPVGVGTRFRLVVPFLGRRLALVYRVTEFSAADRTVMLEARSGPLSAVDQISVIGPSAARSGGRRPHQRCTVSYRAVVTLRGPLRLLDPLLSRGFRAVGDRAAAGLAGLLATPDEHRTPTVPVGSETS